MRRLKCCSPLLHILAQAFHVLDRGFGQDAMAEVKNVPWASCGPVEYLAGAGLDILPVRKQEHRVQISLYSALKSHQFPPFIQRDAPIEPHYFCTSLLHRG